VQNLSEFALQTVKHFDKIGLEFDIVYSGFLLDCAQIDILKTILKRYTTAKIIIDPVLGDSGKLYKLQNQQFVDGFVQAIKYADILTPNITEAEFLCAIKCTEPPYNKNYIEELLDRLQQLGARTVLLKSLDFGNGKIGVAIRQNKDTQYIWTDKIEGSFGGCGDLFASIVVCEIANDVPLHNACQKACNLVSQAIRLTPAKRRLYGIAFEKIISQICQA